MKKVVTLPDVIFTFDDYEEHPHLNKGEFSLLRNGDEYSIELKLEDDEKDLAEFRSSLNLNHDSWWVSFDELRVNSQLLGEWDHPWAQQAMSLRNASRITLNFLEGQVGWTPIVLGEDEWLKTEGKLTADGNLNVNLELDFPPLQDWLPQLPLELPFQTEGDIAIRADIDHHWFRPTANVLIQTEGIGVVKTGFAKSNFGAAVGKYKYR